MDNKKLEKKILAIIATLVFLTTYNCVDYEYHPNYEIVEENPCGPFACYSYGNIYIGSSKYLKNLTNITENDILVEDQRFSTDPNMKIYSSYKINDKKIRNEILEVLCKYEECYPSPWNRSIESMRLEWLMHNVSYHFNHEKRRAGDVDLNNNDEAYYDKPVLRKILKL